MKDYHLEDSLEHLGNKTILSCFKYFLTHKNFESCGFFRFNKLNYNISFNPIQNENLIDQNYFFSKNSFFYECYLNNEIIALAHSHINSNVQPSENDIFTSHSFRLPSFIFSTQSKETYLHYPENYQPYLCEKRLFLPYFQDCMTYVKDYLHLHFNINLNLLNINWSRRKENPNDFLFKVLNTHFFQIHNKKYQNGDILIFQPTIQQYNHLGIIDCDDYLFHHPIGMLPKKELITNELLNQVYKVYRYKDL